MKLGFIAGLGLFQGIFASAVSAQPVLRVSITPSSQFDSVRKEKLLRAGELLERVVNSSEFAERVVGHLYRGAARYVQNEGLTNEQVLERIRLGQETLNGREDRTIDLEVDLYYTRKNVIGYTYPNVSTIWSNRRYFDAFTEAEIAANLMHEWLHKIGFDHDFKKTRRRPYSVPYAVGSIAKVLARRQISWRDNRR